MKLSKVKKICTDAGQLCVVNTTGLGNNLVQQWVGTQDALYPMEGFRVDEGMLQKLWELSPAQIAAIEAQPVHHDEDFLRGIPGQIDQENVEPLSICNVMGMRAMKCGEGVVFVDPELFRPCGDWFQFVMMEDSEGPWVAIYHKGVLDGLVRPLTDERAEALMACARETAKRDIVRWRRK